MMNVKNFLAITLSGLVLTTTGVAFADCGPSIYLGTSASYNHINTVDFTNTAGENFTIVKKNKPGFDFFLGGKFNKFVGTEVGYSFTHRFAATGSNGNTGRVKIRNVYVDLMGFYPIWCKIELLASVGLGRMSVNLVDNTGSGSRSKIGFRGRVGAQQKFYENFGVRFMLGAQQGVNPRGIKANTFASVGITYMFTSSS